MSALFALSKEEEDDSGKKETLSLPFSFPPSSSQVYFSFLEQVAIEHRREK